MIPEEYQDLKGFLTTYTEAELRFAIAVAEILKREGIGLGGSSGGGGVVGGATAANQTTLNTSVGVLTQTPATDDSGSWSIIQFLKRFSDYLRNIRFGIGASSDNKATTDTGTFSLISLVKKALDDYLKIIPLINSKINSTAGKLEVDTGIIGFSTQASQAAQTVELTTIKDLINTRLPPNITVNNTNNRLLVDTGLSGLATEGYQIAQFTVADSINSKINILNTKIPNLRVINDRLQVDVGTDVSTSANQVIQTTQLTQLNTKIQTLTTANNRLLVDSGNTINYGQTFTYSGNLTITGNLLYAYNGNAHTLLKTPSATGIGSSNLMVSTGTQEFVMFTGSPVPGNNSSPINLCTTYKDFTIQYTKQGGTFTELIILIQFSLDGFRWITANTITANNLDFSHVVIANLPCTRLRLYFDAVAPFDFSNPIGGNIFVTGCAV